MRTTAELREGFLSYFELKGHLRRASAPVVPPSDDPTTLFTVAGMQPMKRWFLGAEQPPAPRVVTAQKVMRAGGKHNDLDDVGRTARHASFFEMLGNFSFGDYFKDGAIDLAWEFVTNGMGFPRERLWTTVFAGDPVLGLGEDEVAVAAWERVGVPRERIRGESRSENFWQAAETGPCGPCSEIFLDRGEELGCGRPECGPNCPSCDRFLEFWNLVFMEFDLHEDGSLTPLPKQNIDTGLGLERGAMLLQGVDSIFETDGYRLIMEWVADRTGVRYGESDAATKAHRVLADHGRAMTFLMADGVRPGNEGREYVLRRVIRRAIVHGRDIGLVSFLPDLADVVVEQNAHAYPELAENRGVIRELLAAEEARFVLTLDHGERLFGEAAEKGAIAADDAFRLHDTYGYPIELTVDRAEARGLAVDVDGFRNLMEEQRERSRAAGGGDDVRAAEFARTAGFETEFVGYEKTDVLTQIGALEPLADGTFLAKLRESPFYAEGGGQVSDRGWIEKDGAVRAELVAAYRFGDDQALVFAGEGFEAGDRVRAVVPWRVRFPTMANHTGTHALHRALREVLGEHVRQAGSAVRPDKLRFDFTHGRALTPEERARVEDIVNERIFENLPVRAFLTPIDEARRLGATMLFGEKYGDVVRVVEIPGFSRELCGGTHVRSTAEIGPFAILSEGSVGSGVRRIEAVTSGEAFAHLRARAHEADELRAELERARREAKAPRAGRGDAYALAQEKEHDVDGVTVYVALVEGASPDELLEVSDREKQKRTPAAVVLGSADDGRVHLVVNIDRSLEARGLDAVKVVREAAALVGGGGGGRATMARAGGRDAAKLPDALAAAERALLEALS